MNGLGFERYVANLLRAQGLTVYRSAASRGCADLVVSNDERQYLTVQCKKHGRVRYVRESGVEPREATDEDACRTLDRLRKRAIAAANDVPNPSACTTDTASIGRFLTTASELYDTGYRGRPVVLMASARASAPSVGSPSSGREDEEASTD